MTNYELIRLLTQFPPHAGVELSAVICPKIQDGQYIRRLSPEVHRFYIKRADDTGNSVLIKLAEE